MRRTVKTAMVLGAAVMLLGGSFAFAADRTQTRDRIRLRDQSCLTTQNSGTQSRQMFQQRLNQGSGTQTRTQHQFRGGR
jgi:hypothetical protein